MINLGEQVKDFTRPSTNGSFTLSDKRGKKVILYFYPKDNTPGCTTEALEFRDLAHEFAKENVVVVGVSKDTVKSHEGFRDKLDLNFELISDPDKTLHDYFEVIREKQMYGKKVLGTVRSTFLIDEEGKLIKVYDKVKAKGHAQQVLEDIRGKK